MEKTIFEECYKHYLADWKLGETWNTLSEKYSYANPEALRSSFKRERQRRGLPNKNLNTNFSQRPRPPYPAAAAAPRASRA